MTVVLPLTYTLDSRQQYPTFHTLTNITKNIRKTLDDGDIGCGVKLLIL